jgi:hypothetical protein
MVLIDPSVIRSAVIVTERQRERERQRQRERER